MKISLSSIIEKHQNKTDDSEARNYIGASSIGSECLRKIWYEYKGFKGAGVPAKTRRTWDLGKHIESLIIAWLVNAGLKIETSDFTYVSENVPNFQGHFDGILIEKNAKYILEIKTAKNSSFNIFVKKGLKVWNPQYYAQVQSYMGLSGIHGAYILVLNKDNSELSDEFVAFDEIFYEALEDKALMISIAKFEPPKINASPLWVTCKMCKFNKECHK